MDKTTLAVACIASTLCLPPLLQARQSAPLLGGSPAMDYSRQLLKRTDVQEELRLGVRQKEALARVLPESPARVVLRVVQRVPPATGDPDPQEIARQAAAQAVAFMEEQRREVDALLRPEQRKRLHEIDLQFRSVLALGDQGLSEVLGVEPEHYRRIAAIVADFEVKRLTLLSLSDDTGSLLAERRERLLRDKEGEVFLVLSDAEKQRWAQALGEPFQLED